VRFCRVLAPQNVETANHPELLRYEKFVPEMGKEPTATKVEGRCLNITAVLHLPCHKKNLPNEFFFATSGLVLF